MSIIPLGCRARVVNLTKMCRVVALSSRLSAMNCRVCVLLSVMVRCRNRRTMLSNLTRNRLILVIRWLTSVKRVCNKPAKMRCVSSPTRKKVYRPGRCRRVLMMRITNRRRCRIILPSMAGCRMLRLMSLCVRMLLSCRGKLLIPWCR